MIPLFGNERRRQINLGGSSSASSISHTTILNQARQRRLEREDNKRRHDNAIRLQAWWRGMRESRITRNEMRKLFMENVTSLTGLRCLVLIRDEEILGKWSSAMIESGEGRLHLRFYHCLFIHIGYSDTIGTCHWTRSSKLDSTDTTNELPSVEVSYQLASVS